MKNIFYTYIHLDPRKPGCYEYGDYKFDYSPYYVGKGKYDQCLRHIWEIESGNNKHKKSTIKNILKENLQPIIIKIKENLIEQEAFDLEIKLIRLIGRSDLNLGPLTNMTDGGEGGSGHIPTEYAKQTASDRLKKLWLDPEKRSSILEKVKIQRKGNNHSCKEYEAIYPDGTIEKFKGLKRFCEKNDFNLWTVLLRMKKKIPYKGILIKRLSEKVSMYWQGKTHTEEYKFEMSKNISKIREDKYWSSKFIR